MPTYEYRCKACDAELEIFHSMSEDARTECPECGEHKLKRLISAGGGVIFKGSGFYQTDYRSESYKAGEKAAKDSKSEATKSSSKSSETKSDSSSESSSKKTDAT